MLGVYPILELTEVGCVEFRIGCPLDELFRLVFLWFGGVFFGFSIIGSFPPLDEVREHHLLIHDDSEYGFALLLLQGECETLHEFL
jgi:hypothetical protein